MPKEESTEDKNKRLKEENRKREEDNKKWVKIKEEAQGLFNSPQSTDVDARNYADEAVRLLLDNYQLSGKDQSFLKKNIEFLERLKCPITLAYHKNGLAYLTTDTNIRTRYYYALAEIRETLQVNPHNPMNREPATVNDIRVSEVAAESLKKFIENPDIDLQHEFNPKLIDENKKQAKNPTPAMRGQVEQRQWGDQAQLQRQQQRENQAQPQLQRQRQREDQELMQAQAQSWLQAQLDNHRREIAQSWQIWWNKVQVIEQEQTLQPEHKKQQWWVTIQGQTESRANADAAKLLLWWDKARADIKQWMLREQPGQERQQNQMLDQWFIQVQNEEQSKRQRDKEKWQQWWLDRQAERLARVQQQPTLVQPDIIRRQLAQTQQPQQPPALVPPALVPPALVQPDIIRRQLAQTQQPQDAAVTQWRNEMDIQHNEKRIRRLQRLVDNIKDKFNSKKGIVNEKLTFNSKALMWLHHRKKRLTSLRHYLRNYNIQIEKSPEIIEQFPIPEPQKEAYLEELKQHKAISENLAKIYNDLEKWLIYTILKEYQNNYTDEKNINVTKNNETIVYGRRDRLGYIKNLIDKYYDKSLGTYYDPEKDYNETIIDPNVEERINIARSILENMIVCQEDERYINKHKLNLSIFTFLPSSLKTDICFLLDIEHKPLFPTDGAVLNAAIKAYINKFPNTYGVQDRLKHPLRPNS